MLHRHTATALLAALLMYMPTAHAQPTTTDAKVAALIAKMTLPEKAGQMTQLSVDVLAIGEPYNLKVPMTFDAKKMDDVLVKNHIGSILNVGTTAHTPQVWQQIIKQIQDKNQETRLKIPILYGIDAIHGANYTAGATLFPQQIGLAATFNKNLVQRCAELCAYETRASNIPWTFAPVMDLGRNAAWARLWEGFGEDVHLSSQMGVAMVKGFQGEKNQLDNKYKVATCLKHYAGYGAPISGKDRTPAWIPERYMQEYYLPGFQKAIAQGAPSIMINSGETNGIPAHADYHLLTEILRNQLKFEGFTVSDWEDVYYLYTRHHTANSLKDAVRISINAGIDMAMVPMDVNFAQYIIELVNEGKIDIKRIDEAVSRILKVKYQLGLFEKTMYPLTDYPDFASAKHKEIALQAALEATVLLKNNNDLLPLAAGSKVLVCGPTANSMRPLNGGWTYSWQGNVADEYLQNENTIYDALAQKLGKDNVKLHEVVSFEKNANTSTLSAAMKDVINCDAIVVCLGENSYTEFEGNLDELELPKDQQKLLQDLKFVGKPIILVLAEGRPRTFNAVEPLAKAILYVPLTGNEGGNALAQIITGSYNPSGKMPITYPRYSNALINYDHKYTEAITMKPYNPQFEFGFGLSYTTFEYTNLRIDKQAYQKTDNIILKVDVQNTGKREGAAVVQVYISDLVASITPPVKRLRAFEKTVLKPEETKTINFSIAAADLAFVGLDDKWVLEPGKFTIKIDSLSTDFEIIP
jgi:beta-glucosidase